MRDPQSTEMQVCCGVSHSLLNLALFDLVFAYVRSLAGWLARLLPQKLSNSARVSNVIGLISVLIE